MGEIELDGSTAARLEVDEQRAVLRAEHVARMRFAVEQLLLRAAVVDRPSYASQPAAEEHAVCVGELRRQIRVGNDLFRLGDSIGEVWVATSTLRMPTCSRSSASASSAGET